MVSLKPMTRQMCHEFYKNFQNDPAIGHYYEYLYTPEIADRYFDTNSVTDRKLFAIMVGDRIVGECKLKNIDHEKRECSMGIHLQNDAVKGKGYGTQAERLILQYAFEELGMVAVNADAALKNTRSQHVLEKVGFRYTHEDDTFKYYRCENDELLRVSFAQRKVRNAAKALIIHDDKMLAIKISDGKEEWYIMPGGGQDTEELLPDAVCREVAEELGLKVAVKDLVFVIEGLHGENFHRVDLVFLCKYIGKIESAVLQADTNQVGYDWLDIKTLNTTPLYPSKLRRQIMNLYEGKAYKVYLGNEEIGDPEVTD